MPEIVEPDSQSSRLCQEGIEPAADQEGALKRSATRVRENEVHILPGGADEKTLGRLVRPVLP